MAGPGPDFIYFESSPDFIMSVRSRFYHVSSDPYFIHFESGTDFIMPVRVRILSRKSGLRVRFRILSIFESGFGSESRFYPSSAGPDII